MTRSMLLTTTLVMAILLPACTDGADPFLLFADGPEGVIYHMNTDGTGMKALPLGEQANPVALTYDPLEKMLYWCDIDDYVIKKSELDGTGQTTLIQLTRASSPEGIVIDPIAHLLFYADNGRDTINVLSLDGKDHKVIVDNAKHPRGLQIDPINRMVYWSDWGLGTIERTDYTGAQRTVILDTGEGWINGLALDITQRQMYWTEAQKGILEVANMDNGSGRRVLISANSTNFPPATSSGDQPAKSPHFYGVTVDENYLYFTDWTKGVYRATKDGSTIEHIGPSNFTVLNNIIVHDDSYKILGTISSCNRNNSGCSNLCIPRPAPSTPDYLCVCPDFRRLNTDGKTCHSAVQANGPDLIWLEHDNLYAAYIKGIKGETRDYLRTKEIKTWSVKSPAWHWTALDIDYTRNSIFCVDKLDRYIIELSLNGSLDVTVVYYGISSDVNGIAVDWVAGNVYWTDSLYNWIMMAKIGVKTDMYKPLVTSGLDKPHGIAVWPQKGKMIWSDWGVEDKIEVARMDGADRQVLVSTGLNKPRGITIDYQTERIFWCNEDSIESILLSGESRTIHAGYYRNRFIDITLYKNYIYATDEAEEGQQPQLWFYDRNITTERQTGVRLGLLRKPYGISMYDRSRQEIMHSSCANKRCQHLCVTLGADHSVCLCKDGYILQSDQTTCKEDTGVYAGPAYVYSVGNKLCAVNHQEINVQPEKADDFCFFESNQYQFTALAYNYLQGEVYFSDTKYKVRSIRRAHMTKKDNNTAIIQGVGVVKGIAVDYLSSNLYWTDSTLNQIWVSRLDGSHQKILLRGLNKPHGIALDLQRKKMYWSEQGDGAADARIRTAQLDGSNSRNFVSSNLEEPAGLEVDYTERRLYWLDTKRDAIASIGLDEMTRRDEKLPITDQKRDIYDFAVFQDYIVYTQWSDKNATGIHAVLKKTGTEVSKGFIHPKHGKAFDVVAFAQQNQPDFSGSYMSFCGISNGNCEHICIQQLNNFKCVCTDGFKLGSDGKSCNPVTEPTQDNFMLIADDYRRQIFQADSELQQITALRFPAQDRPIAVEYDFLEQRVYWSDFSDNLIKRMFLNGTKVQTVRGYVNGSRIDGLAFEKESRLLYYTDTTKHIIGVYNPDGSYHKVLVKSKVLNPRAIVLDPTRGYMYYTHRETSKGRIERRKMDGSDPVVLVSGNSSWPSGLAINFTEGKMYWCDSHTEKIESANLDGTDRKTIAVADAQGDPFAVEELGNSIFWTDWNIRGIFVAKKSKQPSNATSVHYDLFSGLNDIKYFSTSKFRGANACSINNGGCSHFCIPAPEGKVCACPDGPRGTINTTDGYNCDGVPTCPKLIANGQISTTCPRRIGSECRYTCFSGFGPSTTAPLKCLPGLTWNVDTDRLCRDETCPFLITPVHSRVNDGCPRIVAPGAWCRQQCMDGYVQAGGDQIRRCQDSLQWSGTDIQCIKRTKCAPLPTPDNAVVDVGACAVSDQPVSTICTHTCKSGYVAISGSDVRICNIHFEWRGAPLVCQLGTPPPVIETTLNPGASQGSTDQSNSTTPIIIGIVITAVILVIIIVLSSIYVYRRYSQKGRYREQSNMRRLEEEPPTPQVARAGAELNGKAAVYDARHGSVAFGNNAYDNPAYGTYADVQAMSGAAPALPHKEALSDGMVDITVTDNNSNNTAFANPMFEREKEADTLENGTSVKPDLTRELSKA